MFLALIFAFLIGTDATLYPVNKQFADSWLTAFVGYMNNDENSEIQMSNKMSNDVRMCFPQSEWMCTQGRAESVKMMKDIRTKLPIQSVDVRWMNLNTYDGGFNTDFEEYDMRYGSNCFMGSNTGSMMARVNDAGEMNEIYVWYDDPNIFNNILALKQGECLAEDVPRTAFSFAKMVICQATADVFNQKMDIDTMLTKYFAQDAMMCGQGICYNGHEEIRSYFMAFQNVIKPGSYRMHCELGYHNDHPFTTLTTTWAADGEFVDGNDRIRMMGMCSVVVDSNGKIKLCIDNTDDNDYQMYISKMDTRSSQLFMKKQEL